MDEHFHILAGDVHRRHVGRQKRDPGLEVSLHRGAWPLASCTSLAEQLLGRLSSPSQAAIKAELCQRVHDALFTPVNNP
jgi:RNA polymerase sigma-70 factor (ECF subfamily)